MCFAGFGAKRVLKHCVLYLVTDHRGLYYFQKWDNSQYDTIEDSDPRDQSPLAFESLSPYQGYDMQEEYNEKGFYRYEGGTMIENPDSRLESLPLDVLHLLFTCLNGADRLLFALASPLLWNTYMSTKPTIPILWTPIIPSTIGGSTHNQNALPENYPSKNEIEKPLGCLLQQWMKPKYRMIRFSKEQGKNSADFKYIDKSELPPFFVKTSWRDSKYWFHQDDSKLIRRYAIYHACLRSVSEETGTPTNNSTSEIEDVFTGKKYLLPHPRGMSGYSWYYAVKKTIEDDKHRWQTWDEWEQWWLNYRWWGLERRAKDYADELVRDGLGIPDPNQNSG